MLAEVPLQARWRRIEDQRSGRDLHRRRKREFSVGVEKRERREGVQNGSERYQCCYNSRYRTKDSKIRGNEQPGQSSDPRPSFFGGESHCSGGRRKS